MTYLEQYYKRLSEQLNERYINLQKLSLLLETPGIEDVKKHFGTMREDQFEEYMKSDPGIEERARAFRKEYLDQANAGQSSRSQSRQSSQSSGSQSSQGSNSQGSQRSSSQRSSSQGSSSQGSSSQGSQRSSSQGSSSQGSSSQGSKSYYGPYSSAQGDQWAHMSDWDFNHDWIHRPENAEFKNNRTYAEAAWRAAQSRAKAAKNQSSQGSQSNSAGNAGQSKASPPPEPPPPPPTPEPQPTSAGQRWKNAGTQSSKTIEDVITRVSNIGNNAARYAKNIPYSTIGKNVGKGAATLGVGVGVDLATQKALDVAGYKDKTGKEMIGAQVGGAASGVVGGALAGTALLPAAITGAVAGGVGYGAYKVGETIGDKTGFHDAIGNYFGGASKLNEPKTGFNGSFQIGGTTPRYKENIKDENSKPKVVNVSDIINKIINQ